MKGIDPYLSIIVTGRNDQYGGDFNRRLQIMLDWNSKWAGHYQIRVEMLFVNFNPIPDKPSLSLSVDWPSSRFWITRFLTISPEESLQYQQKYKHSLPFPEFLAKNIGIRKAKGLFLLVMNADILMDPDLLREISLGKLEKGKVYRATRIDTRIPIEPEFSTDLDQLVILRRNAFKFFFQEGVTKFPLPLSFSWKIRLSTFYLKIRKFIYVSIAKIKALEGAIPGLSDYELFLFDYPFNACGEFLLLDKDTMMDLKGFQEDTMISTHVDSLFLLKCISRNLEIISFDYPVYHQDHPRQHDFDKPSREMDNMWQNLLKAISYYHQNRSAVNDCPEDWGMKNQSVKEIQP